MDVYELVNELIRNSGFKTEEELQRIVDLKIRPFSAIVSTTDERLVFEGIEQLSIYEYIKNELYHMNKEIENTVSFNDFIKNLNSLLLESKRSTKEITKETIKNMIDDILGKPVSSFLIIKGIYGIKLNNNDISVKLGPFEIFFQPTYKKVLEKTYPEPDFLWHNWHHEYLVTICINARSDDKANELANKMLYQLELFIYFAVGHYKKEFCINIVSKITYKYTSYLVLDEKTLGVNYSNDIVETIPLDDSYFMDNSIGNDKIWDLLFVRSRTPIEKRIITSIEWIGKANSEINYKNRFLFYVIAIEAMLTFQEKTLISPSIAHSISESIAMLLGKNYEERITIEKTIKEIYSVRSAIAHGSEKEISDEVMSLAMSISRNVVIAFLTDVNLIRVKTVDEFTEHLKKMKYG